jgi:methylmalonyl-CoA/ethylmalonyl-CoA epimerase
VDSLFWRIMIKKINHIAIVTPDLDEATPFWAEALGLAVAHREHIAEQGVDVAMLPIGESSIELLQPTDMESGVARFMAKRGPGIHHICLEVEDLDAALARLKAAAVPLINEEPTIGAGGRRMAFIHPKGAGGVLVELYE